MTARKARVADIDDPEAFGASADALVDRAVGLLGGHPAELQGAVLADLVALWVAGHRVSGDRAEGDAVRAELLALHSEHVGELVEMYLDGVDG